MQNQRGGCQGISCSHHPTGFRGYPSSGRRGFILLGALIVFEVDGSTEIGY